jgi:hypothetical protein
MPKLAIVFFLFLVGCESSKAQSLSISGATWLPTISTVTEAGSDYSASTLTSASNQSLLSVTMPTLFFILLIVNNHYTVQVKSINSGASWSAAGLKIYAKRTGNGSGGGSSLLGISDISGGNATFQELTSSDAYFFEGNNYGTTPRSGIPIQFQITGVSVLAPVANYSTSIIFTLIDD